MVGLRCIPWVAVIAFVAIGAQGCKHGKCNSGPTSTAQGRSHNAGQDCMRCHLPDGAGEICWRIAGTIYDQNGQSPMAGASVRFFTGPQGTGNLQYSITSDANGNIHTSDDIAFGNGLFPAIVNGSDTAFMTEPIHDGACNRCHGVSTARVQVP